MNAYNVVRKELAAEVRAQGGFLLGRYVYFGRLGLRYHKSIRFSIQSEGTQIEVKWSIPGSCGIDMFQASEVRKVVEFIKEKNLCADKLDEGFSVYRSRPALPASD